LVVIRYPYGIHTITMWQPSCNQTKAAANVGVCPPVAKWYWDKI
jgi:hypothetical protein